MQNQWEIQSRAHRCAHSEKEFVEGEYFYTLLFRDGDGFRREDVCEEVWENRNDNIRPFSFWRSKYEPPPPPEPEALPRDDAEGLLRRMIEEQKPETLNARYILALMLERKKVLRPMDSEDEDLLVYEHLASGDTFVITNPRLSLEQIPAVQTEVSELLAGSMSSLPD